MLERYKHFMPETPIDGRLGFYPCKDKEEWSALPLPLRCATWYRSDIEAVIFDAWFDNYAIRANVEVHPENIFKALFTMSGNGTQLYSVVGIRLKDGTRRGAKWLQDQTSGAYAIVGNHGEKIAEQGGFRGHMPENCIDNGGKWGLVSGRVTETTILRYCLV